MVSNSIVHRYIFREMIPPFLISLAFLTFVFLMVGILDITHLIVNYGAGLFAVLLLLIYSMPFFLQFTIPMSIMMAVLLSFLRLSTDNEIIALTAGGRGIHGLLPPVFVFCGLGCLATGLVAMYGLPTGRLAFRDLSRQVALTSIEAGLKEKMFNDSFDGIVLYVNRINLQTRTFQDIFIEDQRRPGIRNTIVAPEGRLLRDPGRSSYLLRLINGSIHQADPGGKAAQAIRFGSYDFSLDVPTAGSATRDGPKDEEEMGLGELRMYLQGHASAKDAQYYLTLMEYHKKFSLPAACLALGLVAVPLGLGSRSSRRSYGVGLGLVFFLGYYLLLSAGWVFGESGQYPPLIGMWVPNILMGSIGLVLIIRRVCGGRMRPAWWRHVNH